MDAAELPDRLVLALTIVGEARGEPLEGQVAVACVIRNRVRRAVNTAPRWRDVCLAPRQFSCWNTDDPNRRLLEQIVEAVPAAAPHAAAVDQALWIADGVMSGACLDNTGGATNYLTTALLLTRPPTWARNKPVITTIGAHSFLNA